MPQPIMRIAGSGLRSLPLKVNFTVSTLSALTCPQGKTQAYVYDTNAKGLTMLVTASGVKTFYLYKKIDGRPQRIRLGSFPEITIEQARRLTTKWNGQIADGMDPVAAKRKKREAMTLGEAWDWFFEHHAKARKRSWHQNELQWNAHLETWKARRMEDITPADVQALHAKIGTEHPYKANRVLSLLRTIYNKAKVQGYTGTNPTSGVERFPEQSRERFLHPDELPKFFAALDDVATEKHWRDFFKVLLLTGARKGNVMSMKWADVNLDRREWVIPAAEFKANRAMTVHLSPEVVEILKTRANSGEWVFPSDKTLGHIVEPNRAWLSLLERAGLSNLRMHDLRRTLGSWQAAGGASLPIIGKSLGHSNVATTQIYARLSLDPVRQSVNAATAALIAASKAKPKKKDKQAATE